MTTSREWFEEEIRGACNCGGNEDCYSEAEINADYYKFRQMIIEELKTLPVIDRMGIMNMVEISAGDVSFEYNSPQGVPFGDLWTEKPE